MQDKILTILFIAASASFGLMDVASAREFALAGTHSRTEIAKACEANGGSFYNGTKKYGCIGTGGTVDCTAATSKCTGITPDALGPQPTSTNSPFGEDRAPQPGKLGGGDGGGTSNPLTTARAGAPQTMSMG